MRKMFVRVDDVGYTEVYNIGAFEALSKGIGTSADVMLECPGTEDALRRLKEMPWISVGWHYAHMWGAPLLPKERVSSLIDHEGLFEGRFRTDIRSAADVNYDELEAELREELTRCIDIYGRAPVSCDVGRDGSPFSQLIIRLCDEYGIAYHFQLKKGFDPRIRDLIYESRKSDVNWAAAFRAGKAGTDTEPAPQWEGRKIVMLDGNYAYRELLTDSIASVEANYDPVKYYVEDEGGMLSYPDDTIVGQAWHPGYVDYFVYRMGEHENRSRAQQFVICRTQDAHALCSDELKSWVKEQHIELVSIGDAIYNRHDYQNHLRVTGSDLAV